ncbi:DUF4136 domain-containing protein [Kaarinaea lacus]
MVVCLAALLLLGGCVTKPVEPNESAKIRPTAMTIVSSFRSKARYYPGSRFALAAEPAHLDSDNRISGDAMSALIEEAIISSLQQMGYQYSNSTEAVDFLVAYQLAMGDANANAEIGKQEGVQPGLAGQNPDSGAYEKGTLVVDISQGSSKIPVWNGAIQAFVVIDLPEEERKVRVHNAVSRLLRGFATKR